MIFEIDRQEISESFEASRSVLAAFVASALVFALGHGGHQGIGLLGAMEVDYAVRVRMLLENDPLGLSADRGLRAVGDDRIRPVRLYFHQADVLHVIEVRLPARSEEG